jgi:hypothetical protein
VNSKSCFPPLAALAFLALAGAAPAQTAPPSAPPVRITPAVPLPFTEDFESGEINTNVWDIRVHGNASIKVTEDRTAHGKHALTAHYPAGTTRAWAFIAAHLPDSLHDELYGRSYVYISGLPANHSVLLLAGTPGFPVANFLEVGAWRGQFQPSFQQNGDTNLFKRGETTAHEGDVPVGRWFCLEWHFTDKPDRIVLSVDGQQTVDKSFKFNSTNSDLVKGFSEFDLGFRSWAPVTQVTNDIDIYFDDLALSDKPIGPLTPAPDAKPAGAAEKPTPATPGN